uniref:ATP synthase complex subunit 8 n=1 Tax=Hylastes opacus TaxID=1002010 RepID=A0A343A5C1_9CUCU|nr:ATP synthase F0 subunit 8 [Hylastes opacus]
MPQMSPMMWIWLFILFNSTLILTMILNYYSFQYNPNYFNLTKFNKLNKKNWKW